MLRGTCFHTSPPLITALPNTIFTFQLFVLHMIFLFLKGFWLQAFYKLPLSCPRGINDNETLPYHTLPCTWSMTSCRCATACLLLSPECHKGPTGPHSVSIARLSNVLRENLGARWGAVSHTKAYMNMTCKIDDSLVWKACFLMLSSILNDASWADLAVKRVLLEKGWI